MTWRSARLGIYPITATTPISNIGIATGHYWGLNEFLMQWLYISIIAKNSCVSMEGDKITSFFNLMSNKSVIQCKIMYLIVCPTPFGH